MGKKEWILSAIICFSSIFIPLIPQESFAERDFIIEKVPTIGASVSRAYAHTRGENLVVAGKVSRWHKVHVPGHVDVSIYDAHGSLLGISKIRLPGIMSRRKGHLDFSFSSTFDFIPPEGSLIQVQYHGRPSCLQKKLEH